jgi:hypothetical protein
MWRAVYTNDSGKPISNSNNFFETIKGDHRVTTKIQLLDTDFNGVDGGTIYSSDFATTVTGPNISNFVSDGNIDVDVSRGTRRTAELTILNPTDDFTPSMKDDAWDGKLYLNRMVRIWRGCYYGNMPLYVPGGTFMIDTIDVLVEQNMSMVNLTMSDRWKMLTKSLYGYDKVYAKNTLYLDIIIDLLQGAGIDLSGKWGANLDHLPERTSDEKRTGGKVNFKIGDSRGDRLKALCDRWDIDAYFNPMGVFTTEDRLDHNDKDVVWRFYSSQSSDAANGRLVSIRRSFNDDNLYNHVIIIGTGGQEGQEKKKVYKSVKMNTRPESVTNIDRIGDRVYLKQSDSISSLAEADRAAERAWKLRSQVSETIEAKVISNPALEAGDVVGFKEMEHAKLNDTYRVQRFNVPLISSLQTIQCANIIRW